MWTNEILPTVRNQNDALQGESLELRTTFDGDRGRNAILTIDERSLNHLRSKGIRNINRGWRQVDIRPIRRLIICFQCWKYDHTR